jgi:hypothetical protein
MDEEKQNRRRIGGEACALELKAMEGTLSVPGWVFVVSVGMGRMMILRGWRGEGRQA